MGCQGVRPKAQHVEDGRNPPASSGSVPCPMVADHGLCLRRKMTHQFLAWKNQNDSVESANLQHVMMPQSINCQAMKVLVLNY